MFIQILSGPLLCIEEYHWEVVVLLIYDLINSVLAFRSKYLKDRTRRCWWMQATCINSSRIAILFR